MLIIGSYWFSSTLVYGIVQIYLFHKKCANMTMHHFFMIRYEVFIAPIKIKLLQSWSFGVLTIIIQQEG